MPPFFFSSTMLALSIIVLTALILRSYLNSRRLYKLPPGPRGLPIIGNLHQFTKSLWLTLDKWCQEYGPLMYLNAAGQDMIVIGSHKVASELLDRRAGIYSDRPRFIVAGEILSGGLALPLAYYNETWRRMRRAAHDAMSTRVKKKYYPFQEVEAVLLVSSLIKSPELYREHLRRTASSLMISIIYGKPPILDPNDPLVTWIDEAVETIANATRPGVYLVEFFTWMERLPLWMCPWRREAESWFKITSGKFCELLVGVSSRMDGGTQMPCVATNLIEEQSMYGLSDVEAAWTAGGLYVAGAETTSSQMVWFLLAMLFHPEVQKRAHEELDRVVGRARMPTFQDSDHLPYFRALVKEILRWRPVMTMVPRVAMEDNYYEGHFIPKGAVCIANAWALNHDVDVYGPDAHEFRPERFLGPDDTLVDTTQVDTKDEGHVTYGFGRRICVGRYVANNSLFIQMASVLWAFDILPGYDSDGVAVLPDKDAFVDRGIVLTPEPFKCQLRPRFDDVDGIVSATKDNCMQTSATW